MPEGDDGIARSIKYFLPASTFVYASRCVLLPASFFLHCQSFQFPTRVAFLPTPVVLISIITMKLAIISATLALLTITNGMPTTSHVDLEPRKEEKSGMSASRGYFRVAIDLKSSRV